MSAFNDALDLKISVGDQIGNRDISDVWPRLVQMAEDWLNRQLRTSWQEKSATLTFTNGEIDLPDDFLEVVDVYGQSGYRMKSGLRSDSARPGMSFSTYSVANGKIYIRGFTGDRNFLYYAKIPTISGSLSASNWLLSEAGDVYLYAIAFQAAKYLRDVELSAVMEPLMISSVRDLKIQDERQRWANTTTRVQAFTP